MYERNYYAEEPFISRPPTSLYSGPSTHRAAGPRLVVVAAATPSTKTESRVTTRPTTARVPPTVSARLAASEVRARVTAAAPSGAAPPAARPWAARACSPWIFVVSRAGTRYASCRIRRPWSAVCCCFGPATPSSAIRGSSATFEMVMRMKSSLEDHTRINC